MSVILPPEGLTVPLFQCSGCRLVSTRVCVIKTHHQKFCAGAGIVHERVIMGRVNFPISQPGKHAPEPGPPHPATQYPSFGTTNIGNTNTTTTGNIITGTTNNNVTINVFPAGVVAANTDDEVDAAMRALSQNQAVLAEILEPENYEKIAALVHKHTKGSLGPAALRNVLVESAHVVEKRESGEHKVPKMRYAKQTSPRMLVFIEETMDYVAAEGSASPALAQKIGAAKRHLFEYTEEGKKRQRFSRADAVKLCAENNAAFHTQVPPAMKQYAMNVNNAYCRSL